MKASHFFSSILICLFFIQSPITSIFSQKVDAVLVYGKQSDWGTSKVYFFQDNVYRRYNRSAKRVDEGYPLSIYKYWKFEGNFRFGMDACINWGNGKAYMFLDGQYIRYDIESGKTDDGYPLLTSKVWNFPGGFNHNIDAAINFGNGKAYFFKDDQYIRYDMKSGKTDPGYPASIARNWHFPAGFNEDLDAAFNYGNGKAYFFKGDQYIRYDLATGKVDEGYPKSISRGWKGLDGKQEPYKLVMTLDKVKVHSDGDGGADQGDMYWKIKFNGKTISKRADEEYYNMASGYTYEFKDIKKSKESGTYTTYVKDNKKTFKISASFGDADGGLRGGNDDFGSQETIHSVPELLIHPGQRTLRIKNDNGDVELFYSIVLKKWNGSKYVTPSYPKWSLDEDNRPDEDLKWLISLKGKEISKFESITKGNGKLSDLNVGGKIHQISEKLSKLSNSNEDELEAAVTLGSISIEATVDFAAAGPVGAAVGLGIFGTINAIAQPLIFSATDYNNTIFVANYSNKPIKISDHYQYSGTYTYGPKDGVIPGRTDDKIYVAVFVFEKKFGLFGTEGTIEFGAYDDMPKVQVGYSLPYRDQIAIRHKNKCAVQIGSNQSLEDFYDNKVGYDSSIAIEKANASSGRLSAYARISSTTEEFTQMFVAIK